MSKPLVICPSCGSEVPLARYCSSCGSPLMPDIELDDGSMSHVEDNIETTSEDTTSVVETVDEAPLPELAVVVDGVDYLALTYLLTRAELDIIDEELDRLIEQIRATRQALTLDNADKQVLAARAEELKLALDRTKSRKDELLRVKVSVTLRDLTTDIIDQKTKLDKLEEIAPTVDPIVYKEQHKELTERIKQLKKAIKREIKVARQWLKAMKREQREIEREINRLEAKYKIGEIKSTEFELRKSQEDRRLRVLVGGLKLLEEIVRTAENI